MSDYYHDEAGIRKPEPRKKSKRRAQRIYANYAATVRAYIFGRERDICRICRIRRAESRHELVLRSQGGKVSRVNSIAVCGTIVGASPSCHTYIQAKEILWRGIPKVNAEGTLVFTPVTERAAEWMRVAVNQSIESAPMSIYEALE